MKSELMTRYPLLDEIVVIDSGSTDRTVEIVETYGVNVYQADDILPHLEKYRGKGENLWKALYITKGDIIIYLDADIKNIHHRFAYALIGPLILTEHIKYAKAFYDRPIAIGKNKVILNYHTSKLEDAGMITKEKKGRFVYHSVTPLAAYYIG